MQTIKEMANNISGEIIAIRHDIHSHPELSNNETRTAALIKEKLQEYGVDEILNPFGTAIIGVIKGAKGPGKCVGIRCDMDALPVQENTGLTFSSKNDGVMHACGHDIHTASMIGNAKLLCALRNEFAGTVKLIFEPSEEYQPGGARKIIESGVVNDIDFFFSMHVIPTESDVGKIALIKGPVTTSADVFQIEVIGKGAHGSQPHLGKDAILAACQLNILFQQIPARNVDPLDTIILTTNIISGGTKVNILPEKSHLAGCIRCYTAEARETAMQKMRDICRGVEAISGCTIKEDINYGYDACINDPVLVDTLTACFDKNLGHGSFIMMDSRVGFSEDFSFFSTKTGKPSVLMFLYAGHAEGRCVSSLHADDCTFDEKAIPYGMSAMVNAALAVLA